MSSLEITMALQSYCNDLTKYAMLAKCARNQVEINWHMNTIENIAKQIEYLSRQIDK